MNFHQLRLFCTVIERGSITQASQELYITPAAISIQLKRLEKTVGTPLFRRVKTGIIPTQAGRILYQSAGNLMAQMEMTMQRIQRLGMGLVGTIHIGTTQTAALYRLADVLRDFDRAFPGVRLVVRVDITERIVDEVLEGNLDLALEWEPLAKEGLHVETLTTDRFMVAMSPHSPLAMYEVVPADAFERASYLALQYGTNGPLESALFRAGISPRVTMRLPSVDAVKRLVEANQGISLLSGASVEREVAAGYLRVAPLEGFDLEIPLLMVRTWGTSPSPVVDSFVGFLKAHPRFASTGGI